MIILQSAAAESAALELFFGGVLMEHTIPYAQHDRLRILANGQEIGGVYDCRLPDSAFEALDVTRLTDAARSTMLTVRALGELTVRMIRRTDDPGQREIIAAHLRKRSIPWCFALPEGTRVTRPGFVRALRQLTASADGTPALEAVICLYGEPEVDDAA